MVKCLFKKKIVTVGGALLLSLTILGLSDSVGAYSESRVNDEKIKVDVTNKYSDENKKESIKTIRSQDEYIEPETQDNFNLGLDAGTLTLKSSSTQIRIGKIELSGEVMKAPVSFTGAILVSDLRATGEGWHLTVEATPFTEVPKQGGIPPKGGWYRFPTGSLVLKGIPTISAVDPANQSTPPSPETYNLSSNGVAIDDGAITVVSAYYEEGLGDWLIEFPENAMELSIDPTYVKSDKVNYPDGPTPYSSTITWTLISGPGL